MKLIMTKQILSVILKYDFNNFKSDIKPTKNIKDNRIICNSFDLKSK